MANDGYARAFNVVGRRKQSADGRFRAEDIEIISTDQIAQQTVAALIPKYHRGPGMRGDPGEGPCAVAKIAVVGIREIIEGAAGLHAVERDQSVRSGDSRKRPKQNRVDNAEDCRRATDSQRHCQDGSGCKTRTLEQNSKAVTQIIDHRESEST